MDLIQPGIQSGMQPDIQSERMPTPDAPATLAAPLVEVFSAIQGEGANVGTRQIFVRFGGCDLRCHYCDSAHTWHPQQTCRVEQLPGRRDFVVVNNPIAADTLTAWVQQLALPASLHDSISLTGGEPLLQAKFLQGWLPQLRQALPNLPLYLETGGHRSAELAAVIAHLDLVGMDWKLFSVSGESRAQTHRDFLETCVQAGVEVFVKMIISSQTDPAELSQAASLMATVDARLPLYLQPVTALGPAGPQPPAPEQVLAWQQLAKQFLPVVRVVPQTHKMIQQL
jgi:7-carboxy-7-deazaguanine synthase